MGKFKFKNNRCITMDIAGNVFKVSVTQDFLKCLRKFGVEAQEKAQYLLKWPDQVAAMEEACDFCLQSIDSLLGEEASKKIFAGREKDFFDCLDVLNFIASEAKAYGDSLAK